MDMEQKTERELAVALHILRELVRQGKGETSILIHATEGIVVTNRHSVEILSNGSPEMTMKAIRSLDKKKRTR